MLWNDVTVVEAYSGTAKSTGKPFNSATIRDGNNADVQVFSDVSLVDYKGKTVDLDVSIVGRGTLGIRVNGVEN